MKLSFVTNQNECGVCFFKVLVTISIILGSQSVSEFVNYSCLMYATSLCIFNPSPILQAIDSNFYAVCS